MTAIPKVCPHCGAGRENFVADYYEAVRQGIEVIDEATGQYDYTGENYESYDDGSTADECIRCSNCWTEIEVFGEFRLIPMEIFSLLAEGIAADGGHHKQWYLVEIAKKLGIKIPENTEPGIPA